MGNVLGKDASPLITFSCVNVRNSDNVNIDRVDGVEEEEKNFVVLEKKNGRGETENIFD